MFRIHHLLAYQNHLLLVFYTPKGYEFRVVTPQGQILGEQQLYYLPEAARRKVRHYLMAEWENC